MKLTVAVGFSSEWWHHPESDMAVAVCVCRVSLIEKDEQGRREEDAKIMTNPKKSKKNLTNQFPHLRYECSLLPTAASGGARQAWAVVRFALPSSREL